MIDERSTMSAWWPDLVAAGLVTVAFVAGRWATAELTWPVEIDHFRDMGAAQRLLDGGLGALREDPAYRGERWWYSPLLPVVMAGLAKLTGVSLPLVMARGGAFVNLLAPISFYLLARLCLRPWVAIAALAGFLFFIDPAVGGFAQATYAPWPWPVLFAQSFFYLASACWLASLRGVRGAAAGAGVLLGLAFLAHAGPALILALAVTAVTAHGVVTEARGPHLRRLVTIGGLAFLVSAPFLVSLWGHDGPHLRNPIPTRHVGLATRDMLAALLAPRPVLALVGAWLSWQGRANLDPDVRRGLLALTGVTAALLGYGTAADVLGYRGVALPMVVPTFHFFVYLTALMALGFGIGAFALGERLPWPRARRGLTVGIVCLTGLTLYPRYWSAPAQAAWPEAARRLERELSALYRWSRALPPDVVVLTDDHHGMYGVVAAGRRVVCTTPTMSSPYVDLAERDRDRRAMFDALRAGATTRFDALRREYAVTHVIPAPANADGDCCELPTALPEATRARLALDAIVGGVRVYRVTEDDAPRSP